MEREISEEESVEEGEGGEEDGGGGEVEVARCEVGSKERERGGGAVWM